MKRLLLHCLLILSSLSGCTVSRYYYVAEEKIDLYEFPSFSGDPVLTALPGDTVSATGTDYIQLGGKVPVEYAGYSFYSPSAKARFLRIRKVRPKRDAMIPGIAYAGRMRYNKTQESSGLPANYGYTPSTGAAIHTGPRGGRYYINSHGNKSYVPRSGSTKSSTGSSYRSKSSSSGSYRGGTRSYSSGSRGRH